MKYRNKETGVVVEPASELAAQTFVRNPDWEPANGALTATRGNPPEKAVEDMTVPELKALAATLGLTVEAAAKKADIVASINAAKAGGAGSTDGGGAS